MEPYFADELCTLLLGDALDLLRTVPGESVDCVVTSPPYYGLRDYGVPGQYGLEDTPAEYVENLRQLFAECRRVLADDGTCWVNLGDSYSGSWGNQGHKNDRDDIHVGVRGRGALPKGSRTGSRRAGEPGPKNLFGIPWRVAFALQDDGWTLRNAIVWHKPNAMPESVTDRLASYYEHVFLLTKSRRYWFDLDAVREIQKTAGERHEGRGCGSGDGWPTAWNGAKARALNPKGRNPGDMWSIPTRPFPGAHFATFPPELPIRCIKAGCRPGGTVLDPFSGSGTTGDAARLLGRRYLGIDLNPAYHDLAVKRFQQTMLDCLGEAAPTP